MGGARAQNPESGGAYNPAGLETVSNKLKLVESMHVAYRNSISCKLTAYV